MGDLKIVGLRVHVYLWTGGDVGHISISIGHRPYVSFVPDKTDKAGTRRLMDRQGKPASRTDVPGKEGVSLAAYKHTGKLIPNLAEDIKLHGDTSQRLTFTIPNRKLSTDALNKPIRATYQLFDAVKDDQSHNNCVNYVRQELFLFLGDSDRALELKRKLVHIHKPQDFFNSLKSRGVLLEMGADPDKVVHA